MQRLVPPSRKPWPRQFASREWLAAWPPGDGKARALTELVGSHLGVIDRNMPRCGVVAAPRLSARLALHYPPLVCLLRLPNLDLRLGLFPLHEIEGVFSASLIVTMESPLA